MKKDPLSRIIKILDERELVERIRTQAQQELIDEILKVKVWWHNQKGCKNDQTAYIDKLEFLEHISKIKKQRGLK